jgi:hypothetical protein
MNITYFDLLDVLDDDFDDDIIDDIFLGFSPSIPPHSEDHDDYLALCIEAF